MSIFSFCIDKVISMIFIIFSLAFTIGIGFREIIYKVAYDEDIRFTYPITEVSTAIIVTLLYIKFGLGINFVKFIILFSVLIISAIIDYKTMYVYFEVSLVGIIFGVIFGVVSIINGESILSVLISVGIPLVIIGLIMLLSRKIDGMGSGDLEVLLYTALYLRPLQSVLTLILSIVLASIGVFIIFIVKRKLKDIAFVPYITGGTLLTVLFGNEMLGWYMSLL